jgi:hypothetical protein
MSLRARGCRSSIISTNPRRRIVNSCIAIAVGIAATFYWIETIFNFILAPTRAALPPGVKLIYTQPGEAFSLYITVALIAGAIVASPFIHAAGVAVHRPRALLEREADGVFLRALHHHRIALPRGVQPLHLVPVLMVFFASFKHAGSGVHAEARDVFGLYSKMLIGMGLVFQMPAVVLLPGEDEARHGPVPGVEYQVRVAHHFHSSRSDYPERRHEDADHLRRPDAWPLPPQYRNLPGSSGLSAALLPRPEPRPSCPTGRTARLTRF